MRTREPLLAAQHEHFAELASELESRLRDAEGFSRTLALWRLENTQAAVRFVERASHQ